MSTEGTRSFHEYALSAWKLLPKNFQQPDNQKLAKTVAKKLETYLNSCFLNYSQNKHLRYFVEALTNFAETGNIHTVMKMGSLKTVGEVFIDALSSSENFGIRELMNILSDTSTSAILPSVQKSKTEQKFLGRLQSACVTAYKILETDKLMRYEAEKHKENLYRQLIEDDDCESGKMMPNQWSGSY